MDGSSRGGAPDSGAPGSGVVMDGVRLATGDFAVLAAVLATALRTAGLPAGPDRSERLARALTVMRATTVGQLHACALATMVSDPNQVEVFERVFNELFTSGGFTGPRPPEVTAPQQNMVVESAERADGDEGAAEPVGGDELPPDLRGLDEALASGGATESPSEPGDDTDAGDDADADEGVPAVRRVASMTERLRERDFAQLSPSELAQLAALMRDLVIAVPPRRTRRYRSRKDGARLDMRRTMRQATRTGGEPMRIARRAVRPRARRLIVLCDISGSMEPYARAILQLMYVASRSAPAAGFSGPARDSTRPRTEVFTFATRLTRLTPFLAAATPETMLARAGEAAPDWAGGTRIGAALREFNDRYAVRGMGRGAVVLIISDGWETGEPAVLGAQMARLHRIAYRIVWANPRTQSERYRPEVGGMAAAWPYCDAVVSAHNFETLDDLLNALRAPRVHRPSIVPPAAAADAAAAGAAGGGTGAGPVPPLSLPITQGFGRRWTSWRR